MIFVSIFLGGQRQRIALARAILKVTILPFLCHLFYLCSCLAVCVLCLFLAVLWVGLWSLVVAFLVILVCNTDVLTLNKFDSSKKKGYPFIIFHDTCCRKDYAITICYGQVKKVLINC